MNFLETTCTFVKWLYYYNHIESNSPYYGEGYKSLEL